MARRLDGCELAVGAVLVQSVALGSPYSPQPSPFPATASTALS